MLIGEGKLKSSILDAMRRGDPPNTALEIVAAVVADQNFGDAANVVKRPRAIQLLYLGKVRGSVVTEGEREKSTWRLAS
jgi:hypothetical protein